MRVLLTGGCGFLGSNLARWLLARGDSITLFDNLSRVGARENLAWLRGIGRLDFVRGDVRFGDQVSKVVSEARPEAIFHLAGQVAMTASVRSPRLDFEANVLGTINVLEAARHNAPEAAIVYSSTNKVYGNLAQFNYEETATRYICPAWPEGFTEDVPLSFHTPYGCSKGAADQYMLDYARTYGLRTVVFRHSSMYGCRQFATFDQGWIAWFCRQALETKLVDAGRRFTVSGNGKQVRDLLYADDMVSAYILAVRHIDTAASHAFNIGGGTLNSLSVRELLAFLEAELDVRLTVDELPARDSDQRVFIANGSKAERILGWRSVVGWQEGVRRTIQWVREDVSGGSA